MSSRILAFFLAASVVAPLALADDIDEFNERLHTNEWATCLPRRAVEGESNLNRKIVD